MLLYQIWSTRLSWAVEVVPIDLSPLRITATTAVPHSHLISPTVVYMYTVLATPERLIRLRTFDLDLTEQLGPKGMEDGRPPAPTVANKAGTID